MVTHFSKYTSEKPKNQRQPHAFESWPVSGRTTPVNMLQKARQSVTSSLSLIVVLRRLWSTLRPSPTPKLCIRFATSFAQRLCLKASSFFLNMLFFPRCWEVVFFFFFDTPYNLCSIPYRVCSSEHCWGLGLQVWQDYPVTGPCHTLWGAQTLRLYFAKYAAAFQMTWAEAKPKPENSWNHIPFKTILFDTPILI